MDETTVGIIAALVGIIAVLIIFFAVLAPVILIMSMYNRLSGKRKKHIEESDGTVTVDMRSGIKLRLHYLLMLFFEFVYTVVLLSIFDVQKMTEDASMSRAIDKAFIYTTIFGCVIAEIIFVIFFVVCIIYSYSKSLNTAIRRLIEFCFWASALLAALTVIINGISYIMIFITLFLRFRPTVMIYWYVPIAMLGISICRCMISARVLNMDNIVELIENKERFIFSLLYKLDDKLKKLSDKIFGKTLAKVKQNKKSQYLTMLMFEIICVVIDIFEYAFMNIPGVIASFCLIAVLINIYCVIKFAVGISRSNNKRFNTSVTYIIMARACCTLSFLSFMFLFAVWAVYIGAGYDMITYIPIVVPITTMILLFFGRLFVVKYICGWKDASGFLVSKTMRKTIGNDVEENKRLKYKQIDPHLDPSQQWRFRK